MAEPAGQEPESLPSALPDSPRSSDEQITIPFDWYVPDTIISRYANHFTIQRSEDNFYFSFFELRPPLVIGTPEQTLAQLRALRSVRAECVARVVVSKDRLQALTTLLEDGLRQLSAQPGEEEPVS